MPTDVYQDYIQSLSTPNRIHARRWARNGLVPHAVLESELANALNFVSAIRGKNLATWAVPIASIPAGTSTTPRTRWRFAGHTSPFLRRLRAMVLMAPADVTGGVSGGNDNNPSVTVTVTNADESTTYGTKTYSYGTFLGTPVDTPDRFGYGEITIACPADTDIYIRVDDVNGGRVISVSIQEEMTKINSSNGYIVPAGVSVSSPIYDARRELMLETATNAWNKQAAHLWNWTADSDSSPATNATGTAKNLIDTSVTTVSTASPGATLDLRYCKTRSTTTVPVRIVCYAKMSGSSDNGEVWLLDSDGTVVGTIDGIAGTTAAWYTADIDMPDSLGKFDVQIVNPDATETLSVYAFSAWQYA